MSEFWARHLIVGGARDRNRALDSVKYGASRFLPNTTTPYSYI